MNQIESHAAAQQPSAPDQLAGASVCGTPDAGATSSATRTSKSIHAQGTSNPAPRSPQASAHKGARHGVPALTEAAGFGPLTAAAWAEAIVTYWEIARGQPGFDAAASLDVLDLAPGRGATVWMLWQALRKRIGSLPDLQPRLRYLASAPQRQLLLPLRSQQELKPLIADGSLVPVLWDPERGDPCLLSPGGRQRWHPSTRW